MSETATQLERECIPANGEKVRLLTLNALDGRTFSPLAGMHSRSQLFLDLVGLFDRKVRRDRISLACLKTVLLRVRVRTVSKDYKQRPLPESIRYSVISDLIAVEAGTVDG